MQAELSRCRRRRRWCRCRPDRGSTPQPGRRHFAPTLLLTQEAGKSAGMLTLGVPPSVAMRGGFSAADGIFDGYGAGGGLTWRKARIMHEKHAEKQRAQQPNT